MNIGVLALQGNFAEHQSILDLLNVESSQVKTSEDLTSIQGLIIPGGESTAISKLLDANFIDHIKELPCYGTCAGAILLAKWGCIDMNIERNAYGRQMQSFETGIDFKHTHIPTSFIRAPKITSIGPDVEVLAEHNGSPVLVKQGQYLASTFHTETTHSTEIHQYFCTMIPS